MDLELSDTLKKVIDGLSDQFSDSFIEVYQSTGDTFVRVEADAVVDICKYLKSTHHFIYLNDLFGTDRFTSEERFEVVYNLISLRDRERLFLKVRLPEEDPRLESVADIWKSASWMEREVYDMFGVHFDNHPDFRRIFMPEDYEYHPMRKEFPLLGIPGSIELPSTTPDTE
ncbi:NADH-quinone oxidoreductase subunit C [Aliifodinibius salicampi]|uniref:NADH-quinone oxidoreductase subunit C n=1 Tax=Fodinibius salicampi TaxID=1920655 RepID=A0ABT3PW73_9BACT|nr:NADH-quinone oxidoreductase subunit C [Fodinibius salicampi]MCW9712100.1 NADH-quinone oxidoreductase subunit C [Fodinibius salicampi]